MRRSSKLGFWVLALTVFFMASSGLAQTRNNLFFLHHSTGRNIVDEGQTRAWLANFNSQHGTGYVLWDHDYNWIGLREGDGEFVPWIYDIPDDNTDPIGLYDLWTTANAARDSILTNHDVIAFKSCYPASAISTPQLLQQYKTWYLAIRSVFDQHPDKTFVVMSPPPLHRLATDLTQADNARAFANWLKSAEFLQGHANVVCFDLFDLLAAPDTPGAPARNMLRYEYERSHNDSDSHPNPAANAVAGPVFGAALVAAAEPSSETTAPTPTPAHPTLMVQPNPFNPATVIAFALMADAAVKVDVFDLRGNLVRELLDDRRAAGTYRLRWDGRDDRGRDAPAGIYLCRLHTADAVCAARLALMR
jgi:hypothetical protein